MEHEEELRPARPSEAHKVVFVRSRVMEFGIIHYGEEKKATLFFLFWRFRVPAPFSMNGYEYTIRFDRHGYWVNIGDWTYPRSWLPRFTCRLTGNHKFGKGSLLACGEKIGWYQRCQRCGKQEWTI